METAEKKTRIEYIDCYKALAMILVILGHINFANHGVKAWIYSFHMPAFFFIAGLTLNMDRPVTGHSLISMISKYFYRLILPFLLWGLIYSKFSLLNLAKLAYGSYPMISSADSLTSLWFLPAMFISVLLLYVCKWLSGKRFGVIAKICLMAAAFVAGFMLPKIRIGYPWSLNVAFTAFGFILLGQLIGEALRKLGRRKENKAVDTVLVIAAAGICFAGTMVYRLNIPSAPGYILMGKGIYGNPLLFIAAAVCGCGFLLWVSVSLSRFLRGVPKHWLCWFGQNTLTVFAIQKPVIRVFKSVFAHVHVPAFASLILSAAGTVAISCLLCLLINHFAPVLAGRQPQIKAQKNAS